MKKIFIIIIVIYCTVAIFSVTVITGASKGTVKIGNLTWQKCSASQSLPICSGNATKMNFSNAGYYCHNLKLEGLRWRLPTKDELRGLIVNGSVPKINKTLFPNTGSERLIGYWTKTYQQLNNDPHALVWYVDFNFGGPDVYNKGYPKYVRCVSDQ